MTQPAAYTPTTDFSDDELANAGGRSTVKTAGLDAEFSNIATTLGGVLTNLALNQRDDGEIRDERVKMHTLAADVKALLVASGATIRGAWVTATAYALRDVVTQSGNTYICAVAHTSGTFATDLAAVKWVLLSLASAVTASGMPFTPTATIAASNVQAAIEESDTEIRAAVAQLIADMASTSASKGISLSGVRDVGGYFVGADGETVLQEVGAKNTAQDVQITSLLASVSSLTSSLATASASASASAILRAGRTAPDSAFNFFVNDFGAPTRCTGPGGAAVLKNIRDVFYTKYSGLMSGVTVYVDKTNGSDANAGTITAPFATIDKAIRSTACGIVYVMPAVYDRAAATGFRSSDTGGSQPKMLIAPYGGVYISDTGDTVSSATFSANATYTAVYETTLASSNHVTRLLRTDRLDRYGAATPMPKYATLADVNSAGYGWAYDSGTKKLYVRDGTINVNSSLKSVLQAVYEPSGGAGGGVFGIQSAVLYVENITIDAYVSVLKTAAATPEFWGNKVTCRYGEATSWLIQGGGIYLQDCTSIRPAGDGVNISSYSGAAAYGVLINYECRFAGDVDSYGSGASQATNPVSSGQNKNDVSNHDGSVVCINGTGWGAYGPPHAHTDASKTWLLGTVFGKTYATGGSAYGLIVQGSTAQCWADGCSAEGGNSGLNADTSGTLYHFNTFGTRVSTSSGVFTAYTPT